ncbi:MAG: hypothetical protein HUJ65_07905 [Oscillospiraceae bacterium]|nr:hypothetical protein [Oscillospiraceae bacterium]
MKRRILSRLLTMLAVIVLVFALTGCSFSYSTSKTETETKTDANGNTTTTTTTTVSENGKTTTTTSTEDEPEYITATISFANLAEFDIAELYFAHSDDEDRGDNLLDENVPLGNGEKITFDGALTYTPDAPYWDLAICDGDGASVEFEGLDLTDAEDEENITVMIEYDSDDDSYTASVQ